MSYWTHLTGIIKVDVSGRTNEEVMYIVGTVIKHLPRVTGSERDMSVRYHLCEGYDCSSNCDEFGNRSNLGAGYYNSFETQTHVLITVDGNFRDRKMHETVREFNNFLCRLAKRLLVHTCAVCITDDSRREVVITNKNDWLGDLYDWNKPWADYLYWKPNRDEDGLFTSGKPNVIFTGPKI